MFAFEGTPSPPQCGRHKWNPPNHTSTRRLGPKTAILKGIAIDLKDSMIFPAVFDWAQFSDFQVRSEFRGPKSTT